MDQQWSKRETVDALLYKGGFPRRLTITSEVRCALRVERYQSRKHRVTYAEYRQWRESETLARDWLDSM